MTLPPMLDRLRPDPYASALRRLKRTLIVDARVVSALRRAARRDDARCKAAYGWALGLLPEDVESRQSAGEVYGEAAALDAGNAAFQYGLGLAHVAVFGRRRAVPLAARRGFAAAAKLDPDNSVAHIAVAAARLSTGDLSAALTALDAALAATRFEPYLSPPGPELQAAAPWLGQSLWLLWPDRQWAALRFVASALAQRAARGDPHTDERALYADRLQRLASFVLVQVPARPRELLVACGLATMALRVRCQVFGDGLAAEQSAAVGDAVSHFLDGRRRIAAEFERAAAELLAAGGGGTAVGLLTACLGWLRARRGLAAWPARGQWALWVGLATAAGSALAVTTPNPPAAARRRAIEHTLVEAEAKLVSETRDRVRELLPW